MSLGSGSRYSSMASLIFLIASRFVVPQEWQPFKEGQYAWYPSLFGSFSIMILNFIELPPITKYSTAVNRSQGVSNWRSSAIRRLVMMVLDSVCEYEQVVRSNSKQVSYG